MVSLYRLANDNPAQLIFEGNNREELLGAYVNFVRPIFVQGWIEEEPQAGPAGLMVDPLVTMAADVLEDSLAGETVRQYSLRNAENEIEETREILDMQGGLNLIEYGIDQSFHIE